MVVARNHHRPGEGPPQEIRPTRRHGQRHRETSNLPPATPAGLACVGLLRGSVTALGASPESAGHASAPSQHRCPPAATLEAREDTFGEVSDFGVVLTKSALESRRGGVQFGTPGIDSPETGLPRVHSPPRRVSLLPGNRPGWGSPPNLASPRLLGRGAHKERLRTDDAITTCPPWQLGRSVASRLLRVWHSPVGRVNTVQQPPRV